MGNKASKNNRKKPKDSDLTEDDEDSKDEFAINTSAQLPSSIDKILSEQSNKQEQMEKITAFGGKLSGDQPLIRTDDVDEPLVLVLLKKYLFQSFNGSKHVGIMNNGAVENEEKDNYTTEFVANGVVSMDDCNKVKKLICSQKITLSKLQLPDYNNNEKYYAMIFGELIKMWLLELSEPLLQQLPSTFFDGITEIDYLELEIENIPSLTFAALVLIWDICIEIEENHKLNKMTAKRLAAVFAPYLYSDKNKERNAQIMTSLRKFFKVGMQWRKENR